MPSPRPTGSGALKILLLPQLLKDQVLHLVVFSCYSSQPVHCFLLRGVCICDCVYNLDGFFLFVVVVCSGEASLASRGLVPTMLWAILCHVSFLSADIAGDILHARTHTSLEKPSPWPWCSSFIDEGVELPGVRQHRSPVFFPALPFFASLMFLLLSAVVIHALEQSANVSIASGCQVGIWKNQLPKAGCGGVFLNLSKSWQASIWNHCPCLLSTAVLHSLNIVGLSNR